MGRLASIQVLRGLAALGVVLYHAAGAKIGSFGVELFFVISGYVITLSAQGKTPGHFLFDRAWRIYPIYWLAVLPWFFLAPELMAAKSLSSLTLWPVYGADFSQPYLVVGWTLCFEMLFYLAFTFSIWRGSPTIPLAIFLCSMAAMLVYPTALFWFLGSPMIFGFLIGVAMTTIPQNSKLALALLPAALIVLGLSDAAALAQREIGSNILGDFSRLLWWTIPAAVLVYAAICWERLFTRWSAPLVTLGAASYSLYLFHPLITHRLQTHWLIETGLSVMLGLAVWWFVERWLIAAKPRKLRLASVG